MIVGALLARNEAGPDRYLQRALDNAKQFCDIIVVVDDDSTDETATICRDAGCRVVTFAETAGSSGDGESTGGGMADGGFWGTDETARRALLWEQACLAVQGDGWIYFFDADHELIGLEPETLRLMCRSRLVSAWSFPLYDCWDSDLLMRVDGYWQAHRSPRPWLVRALPVVWDGGATRGIHTGHVPPGYPLQSGQAPPGAAIRHLGYVKKEHREAKAAKYLALK